MQEKAWPEKVWGQGHFDKNAPEHFEDMSWTFPMSCPVPSIFSGQARSFPTKDQITANQLHVSTTCTSGVGTLNGSQ